MAEVIEGQQEQTVDERIAYKVNTAPAGGTPTGISVTVADRSNNDTDVTATVMPTNSPSIETDIITLSLLRALTVDRRYRVRVSYTSGGNIINDDLFVLATL